MKIIHHTDSGMLRESEGLSVKKGMSCWIQLVLFTVVLPMRSLFFRKAKKRCVSFILRGMPTQRIRIQHHF